MKREAHLQDILHIAQKPHLSGSPVKEFKDLRGPVGVIALEELAASTFII
jgi:hypothetical protein